MYPTFLFYTYYLLQFGYKPSDRNGRTLSICKPLYGKKYIYIAYILHAFPYIHFLSMKLSFQHQSIIETSRVDNS